MASTDAPRLPSLVALQQPSQKREEAPAAKELADLNEDAQRVVVEWLSKLSMNENDGFEDVSEFPECAGLVNMHEADLYKDVAKSAMDRWVGRLQLREWRPLLWSLKKNTEQFSNVDLFRAWCEAFSNSMYKYPTSWMHKHKETWMLVFSAKKDDAGDVGSGLRWAPKSLQNQEDVVMAAVKQDGLALQYASKELKKNKAVQLAAVTRNGLALRFVPDNDLDVEDTWLYQDVLRAALTQNGMAIEYTTPVSFDFDTRFELYVIAVQQNGNAYDHINDLEIASAYDHNDPWDSEPGSPDPADGMFKVTVAALKQAGSTILDVFQDDHFDLWTRYFDDKQLDAIVIAIEPGNRDRWKKRLGR